MYKVLFFQKPLIRTEHADLALALRANPSACTSHTVLVIDQSGSMRKADVSTYSSRSDAVFASIAYDLIGSRIDNNQTAGLILRLKFTLV
jgi:hypothetical protein